jgi:hypothetical protein
MSARVSVSVGGCMLSLSVGYARDGVGLLYLPLLLLTGVLIVCLAASFTRPCPTFLQLCLLFVM